MAGHDRQHGFGHVDDARALAAIHRAEAWRRHQHFVLFGHESASPAQRLLGGESVRRHVDPVVDRRVWAPRGDYDTECQADVRCDEHE